jgi:hypothetical protein
LSAQSNTFRQSKRRVQSQMREVIFTQLVVCFMSFLQGALLLLERPLFQLRYNMYQDSSRLRVRFNLIYRPMLRQSLPSH